MVLYILKRLLIFIPTLIIIALAAFISSINAPGDPVERLMRAADSEGGTSEQSVASKQARQQLREDLGLDRPVFYVGISTMAHPDTLYRVADRDHKKMLGKLAVKNGNWGRVSDYYHALVNYEAQHKLIVIDSILKQVGKDSLVIKVDSISGALDSQMVFKPQYSRNEITDVRNLSNVEVASILQTADMDVVSAKFDSLAKLYSEYEFMSPLVPELEGAKQTVK